MAAATIWETPLGQVPEVKIIDFSMAVVGEKMTCGHRGKPSYQAPKICLWFGVSSCRVLAFLPSGTGDDVDAVLRPLSGRLLRYGSCPLLSCCTCIPVAVHGTGPMQVFRLRARTWSQEILEDPKGQEDSAYQEH